MCEYSFLETVLRGKRLLNRGQIHLTVWSRSLFGNKLAHFVKRLEEVLHNLRQVRAQGTGQRCPGDCKTEGNHKCVKEMKTSWKLRRAARKVAHCLSVEGRVRKVNIQLQLKVVRQ